MIFTQKPVGIAENEESIMAYFRKTTVYNEINNYKVEKCLHGWWEVNSLTIGGDVHSTMMLCHFDYGKCDLIVLSPTVSFLQSLNLKPYSRLCLEVTDPLNVVVFEKGEEDVVEDALLKTLKERYNIDNLFISSRSKDGNAVIVSEKFENVEFGDEPEMEFFIARFQDGVLKYLVLAFDEFMAEQEGFSYVR